jgi:hypothetical protein
MKYFIKYRYDLFSILFGLALVCVVVGVAWHFLSRLWF